MNQTPLSVSPEQQQQLDRIQIDPSWKQVLAPFLLGEQMQQLKLFLQQQKQSKKQIYPPNDMIFNAFNNTSFDQVKVVILGQDPYHGAHQANGLCFSVQRGIDIPPSLRNIYHELCNDLKIPPAKHGDLSLWSKQGVLLLNSVLTVEAGRAASHQKQGWEQFTDYVVDVLNQQRQNLVFILWGAYAQRKGQRIDTERHLVLTAAHPSPLAANRGGFFGCQVFSKTNAYLQQHDQPMISWQLD